MVWVRRVVFDAASVALLVVVVVALLEEILVLPSIETTKDRVGSGEA